MAVPVLLITGPVGVGKSSVLSEIEHLLDKADMRFAAVELDALSYCHPPPAGDDRFRTKLTLRNLAAIWKNFRAAGAERLILSRVLRSREELALYRKAVPGAEIVVVRLRAGVRTLQERARRREIGLGRAWHVRRAGDSHGSWTARPRRGRPRRDGRPHGQRDREGEPRPDRLAAEAETRASAG